jgi:hypothetical protein
MDGVVDAIDLMLSSVFRRVCTRTTQLSSA